jgi:hypothetical protein
MRSWFFLLCFVPLIVFGCGTQSSNGASQQKRESVDTVSSRLVVDDQKVNTFPTGTIFSVNGLRYIAYPGTDSNNTVNIVSSPPGPQVGGSLPGGGQDIPANWSPPQINGADQVNGNGAVSITEFNKALYYSFNGMDREINVVSAPDGVTWTKQVIANAASKFAPSIVACQNRLWVGFTSEGSNNLIIFSSSDGNFHGDAQLDNLVNLGQQTPMALALACFQGGLYVAWTGQSNQQLNVAPLTPTNDALQTILTFTDTSDDGPGLLGFGDKLILSWRGSGNENINWSSLTAAQLAQLEQQSGDKTLPNKTTITETTDHTPTFANFGPEAALLWTGTDADTHLNVRENVFGRVPGCPGPDPGAPNNGAGDSDGDGLRDCWEDLGIDYDGDGVIDLNLPLLGANRNHADAFIEIDYFDCTVAGGDCTSPPGKPPDVHNHRPQAATLTAVINAFANSPHLNPDGTKGVHLVIGEIDGFPLSDEGLQHQQFCELDPSGSTPSCYFGIKKSNFGTAAQRADPNATAILGAKGLAYHYSLWVHQRSAKTGSTGIAHYCSPDFLVSLGTPPFAVMYEASTLMHEFGHNLGLKHGGDEDTNNKPNYISIMNYNWQPAALMPFVNTPPLPGTPAPTPFFLRTIDYSSTALPPISEQAVSEGAGIGGLPSGKGPLFWTQYSCPNGSTPYARGDTAIDFNCDGSASAATPPFVSDINQDRYCVAQGFNTPGLVTTTTSNDDVFLGGAIVPNGTVLPATPQDPRDQLVPVNPMGFGPSQIIPGPSGILYSMAKFNSADIASGVQIADGLDRICDTTATGTDVQTGRGTGPASKEEDQLHGYDDWSHINLDFVDCPNFGTESGASSETDADEVARRIHDQRTSLGVADLAVHTTAAFNGTSTASTATLTFAVSNAGPQSANSPAINLTLPAGITFASCSGLLNGQACLQAGSTLVVPISPLAAGASQTVTVTLSIGCSVPSGSTVTFAGTLGDTAADLTSADNVISATVVNQTHPIFTFVPGPATITTCVGANIGVPTASDACGPATITSNAPAKFPLGTTVVTWTATDAAGGVATATQSVLALLGDDPSCCPTGTNVILGTSGPDNIVGTFGSDCILGLGGNDVIDASYGDDFISGGAGNDNLTGGPGNDFVFGGAGADTIDSGPDDDFIDGGGGADTCSGGTGTNTIIQCAQFSFCTAACCSTNSCGVPTPPSATTCRKAYSASACTTYTLGTEVSNSGHNWTCSNANCANCGSVSSCAPGATGCPWGTVWVDDGVCQ